MDWDYYGTHPQAQEQSQQMREAQIPDKRKDEGKELPKRAASTPLEGEPYSGSYNTFGLSAVEKRYSCENCQKRHEPPLCECPNCGGPHLISKCQFSGVSEGKTIPKTGYNELWKKCSMCHLCHQGTCPCAKCGELAHIAVECIIAGMEDWSNVPTTKRSKRDQVSPERRKPQTTVTKQMWCHKCGISHPSNEPCKYPEVPKSFWCSSCGGRQNDHMRGCPAVRGTSMIKICKKCGEEDHIQENCTLTGVPCYKCGDMGHIAGECTQMGRFALRHQIYDSPLPGTRPFCQQRNKDGHWARDCTQATVVPEKARGMNKYQEAYEDLRRRDPIASMDETGTKYPSQDYRQINQILEERRNLKEQTPKRELDKMKYQPRKLIRPDKIELELPRNSWTPYKILPLMKSIPFLRTKEKRSQVINNLPLVNKKTPIGRKELQNLTKVQIHFLIEVMVQEVVPELLEEEGEEMNPVTPVEMKDQTEERMLTWKKRMRVVLPQQD